MIGFKPRISGVGSDGFTNCATTDVTRMLLHLSPNVDDTLPTYLPTYLLTHKRVQTLKLIQVSQISKA